MSSDLSTAEKHIEKLTLAGATVTIKCCPGINDIVEYMFGKEEIVGSFWRINIDIKGKYGQVYFHVTGTGATIQAALDQAFAQESLDEIIAAFSLAARSMA